MPDLERSLSCLTIGRGNPRDLGVVRDSLGVAENLRAHMLTTQPSFLKSLQTF